MESPIQLQAAYYVVAIIVGLVATAINITLFIRNKPDRVKTAVTEAIRPVLERVEEIEHAQGVQRATLTEHSGQLTKISTDMAHAPTRQDMGVLHHRITEVVKEASETGAVARMLQAQFQQLNQFLMERGRE